MISFIGLIIQSAYYQYMEKIYNENKTKQNILACIAAACLVVSNLAAADRVLSVNVTNTLFGSSHTAFTYAPSSGEPNVSCSLQGTSTTFNGGDANTVVGTMMLIAMKYHDTFNSVTLTCDSISVNKDGNQVFVTIISGTPTAWTFINGQACLSDISSGEGDKILLAMANDWPMTMTCQQYPWTTTQRRMDIQF